MSRARVVSLVLDCAAIMLSPLLFVAWLIASRLGTRAKLRRGLVAKFLGFPRRQDPRPALWIHAVSVGEVLIAEPLVRRLRDARPDLEIVISVATFTGRDLAARRLPELTVFYAPVDFSPSILCAFRRVRPLAIVLVELELWPNWLANARSRAIPVWVVNGRLSSRSFGRYRRLGPIARRLFGAVDRYAVQSDDYAERIIALGVDPSRVEVLGNMKFDRQPSPDALRGDELRDALGWSRAGGHIIVVAGCTHPGEEAAIARSYRAWRDIEPRLRIVVAPRHVERLVPGEIERWGFDAAPLRWSARQGAVGDRPLVVDTVGELERFYAASDIAIVGGSFVRHGGHNLLEAARLGCPVLFGPHHWNFAEEAHLLEEAGGARQVADYALLEAAVVAWLRDAPERVAIGERGAACVNRLGGSLDRHLGWLLELLDER